MYIANIKAKNYRLVRDVSLDLTKDLSLIIGRNNSGKTSFISLLEKFLKSATPEFHFDDYPFELRKDMLNFNDDSDPQNTAIRLLLDIHYDESDSLENISDFILDLDPEIKNVKILFECKINKSIFINSLREIKDRRVEYIKKNLKKFLITSIYAVDHDYCFDTDRKIEVSKKEYISVSKLINLEVIHAKRDVASSESGQKSKKVLSGLTTDYYNAKNILSHADQNGINQSIIEMDVKLDGEYDKFFSSFLKTSKDFLNIQDLKVVSDLQSKGILENHSKVVYGKDEFQLPEHFNGLGYMNILYLLLQIEIKRESFELQKRDINVLFIEEPEAHTHPQMQYVFIEKIKDLLRGIPGLQTLITSHSAHIVNRCDFKSIRYFLKNNDNSGVDIKNFYSDLLEKYTNEDPAKNENEKNNFKFLTQYLTLNSSELFFSHKIIFIEGLTERLLLPLMMKIIDSENNNTSGYTALSSQNISILEVGANSRAFRHFLRFLKIKTLIITDLDTIDQSRGAVAATAGIDTSNYSLKYFYNAPEKESQLKTQDYENKLASWISSIKSNSIGDIEPNIKVSYQTKENGYQGRSFEDAFISVNLDQIKKLKDKISGLQNTKKLDEDSPEIYDLTTHILKEKSEFASSLLWLALSEDVNWNIPAYIRDGLLWIAAE